MSAPNRTRIFTTARWGTEGDSAQKKSSVWQGIIHLAFFGHLFVGLLAVLLTLECLAQLRLSGLPLGYYVGLVSGVIFFYTHAYYGIHKAEAGANLRTRWYAAHRRGLRVSQAVLGVLAVGTASLYAIALVPFWDNVSGLHWTGLALASLGLILYNGWLGTVVSLRNTGWLKPLVIGWTWASAVTLMPVVFSELTGRAAPAQSLVGWFFVKNLMFVTVNAILFDVKDYADDANRHLKTLVVRAGLRATLFRVVVPLTVLGMAAALLFGLERGMSGVWIIFNQLPFLLTLWLAFSLRRRRPILFYLIAIDGMLAVKAVCGMVGAWWG